MNKVIGLAAPVVKRMQEAEPMADFHPLRTSASYDDRSVDVQVAADDDLAIISGHLPQQRCRT